MLRGRKLPESAALADVVKKLEECRNEAQAKLAELQKNLDAAAASRKAVDEKFVAAQETLAAALAERARREQTVAAAKDALAAAKADVAAKTSQLSTTTSELNDRWANDFTIASLKPLTPEQMCWTVFRVTGVYDRYRQTEVAELDKKKPLTEDQKKDPKQLEARDIELEQLHVRQAEEQHRHIRRLLRRRGRPTAGRFLRDRRPGLVRGQRRIDQQLGRPGVWQRHGARREASKTRKWPPRNFI